MASLAYRPLGVVVSPSREYLWKTPNYWSPQCLTTPPLANVGELNVVTIIDAGRTNYYALNSGVTKPNLTKFLHSKLQCYNSFRNASVLSERRSSKCGRVAAKISQTSFLNSEVSGPMFTIFFTQVAQSSPYYILAPLNDLLIRCWTPEQTVKAVYFQFCKKPPKLVTIAMSLGLLQNLCQFYNSHTRIYVCWKLCNKAE